MKRTVMAELAQNRGNGTSRRRFFNGLIATMAILSIGSVITTSAHADTQTAPNHNDTVFFDKYFLLNNEWGKVYLGWGDGYETLSRDSNNTNGAWNIDFNWWNVLSDDEYHIKAYPSIVCGWQYGTWSNNSGLPIHLWDNKHVYTGWDYSINADWFKGNVSYDLWLDPSTNPSGDPKVEVMVWLYHSNPDSDHGLSSNYVETANIAGTNYRVYRDPNPNRQIIWFVREDTTFSTDIDLKYFYDYLQWAKGWVSNSTYLLSVQAGSEIWHGNGQINTSRYYVNVSD